MCLVLSIISNLGAKSFAVLFKNGVSMGLSKALKKVRNLSPLSHVKPWKKLSKKVGHAIRGQLRKINPFSTHNAQTVQDSTGYYGKRISELM